MFVAIFWVLLWVLLGLWVLCGFVAHGVNKNIAINAFMLGKYRGEDISPYDWKDELTSWVGILLGPVYLHVALQSQRELREQVEFTKLGIDLKRPNLNLEMLPSVMDRSWSLGFCLWTPKECRPR